MRTKSHTSQRSAAEAAVLSRLSRKAQSFVERARSFKSRAERPEPSDNEILLALAGCRGKDKVAFNIAAVIAGRKPAAQFEVCCLTPVGVELLETAKRLDYVFGRGTEGMSGTDYAFIGRPRNVAALVRLYAALPTTDAEFERRRCTALGFSRGAIKRRFAPGECEAGCGRVSGHTQTPPQVREQLEHDELMLRLLDAKRALTGNPNVGRNIEWAITERALGQIEPGE